MRGIINQELRLVVDTNILFAAAVAEGASRRLLDQLLEGNPWRWFGTQNILNEYFKVLKHTSFRLSPGEREELISAIQGSIEIVEAGDELKLPSDPSDAKFLNCADACKADYLLTSDEHLLSADPPGKTRIMNVHDFFWEIG